MLFPFLTVYDYRTIDRTIPLTAGSPEYSNYELTLDAYLDGLAEELEGFVLYLDVMESELDPRDVGQVSLSRSVYLVVINQSGVIYFINPRRMRREGYGSRSVCMCVSVCLLLH